MRKTILITGAAGFIGFHLAEALLRSGHRVVGVDAMTSYYDVRLKNRRLALLKKYPGFTFKKLSILAYEKFAALLRREKIEEIYHFAAQPGVRYSVTNPRSYGDVNYLGTMNVFEAARAAGIKRVIYASSSTVYGKRGKKGAFSEDDRIDTPVSVYGATKVANEALAHAYSHAYGMDMVGIRFFTVYGPLGRPDLGLFIFTKLIADGKNIDLFNHGKTRRAFTSVRDVLPPLVALIKKAPKAGTRAYNLGGAESVAITTLITYLEAALGKAAKTRLVPAVVGDMPETIADCRKAKKELGYEPKIGLREGVQEFVAWYRDNEQWLKTLKESKS